MKESTDLRATSVTFAAEFPATRMTFAAEIEARRIAERFRAPHDA